MNIDADSRSLKQVAFIRTRTFELNSAYRRESPTDWMLYITVLARERMMLSRNVARQRFHARFRETDRRRTEGGIRSSARGADVRVCSVSIRRLVFERFFWAGSNQSAECNSGFRGSKVGSFVAGGFPAVRLRKIFKVLGTRGATAASPVKRLRGYEGLSWARASVNFLTFTVNLRVTLIKIENYCVRWGCSS